MLALFNLVMVDLIVRRADRPALRAILGNREAS